MTLKFYNIIILILCSLSSCLDPITHREKPEIIRWKGMKKDSAQNLIAKKLPLKTSIDTVVKFCEKQGLSPSKITPYKDGFFITASSPIVSDKVMTQAKWLLKFYFDPSRCLRKIELHKSLIYF